MAERGAEVSTSLLDMLKACAAGAPDVLPLDYGDPGGLWVTVRCQNPFDVLLLDRQGEVTLDAVLVRFRVLWKFWTQKVAVARQGAMRAAIRKKYGEDIETYVDNLQWAYDQLSAEGGVAFWRDKLDQARARTLWSGMSETIDATLADGLLDPVEVSHVIARAESFGYEREEFATILRDTLYARRFEPELAPTGHTASLQLASVRWATPETWVRIRSESKSIARVPVEHHYVRVRRSGVVFGPVPADQVAQVIRENGVCAADEICIVGASVWQPITQSQFGYCVQAQGAPSAHACPQCGQALAVITEASSRAGWLVLVIGILTLWLYVGFVLVIIGIVMLATRTRVQRWRCLRCGYAS
jgi:hypothetical protein